MRYRWPAETNSRGKGAWPPSRFWAPGAGLFDREIVFGGRQRESAKAPQCGPYRIQGAVGKHAGEEALGEVLRVGGVGRSAADECIDWEPVGFNEVLQRLPGIRRLGALRGDDHAPVRGWGLVHDSPKRADCIAASRRYMPPNLQNGRTREECDSRRWRSRRFTLATIPKQRFWGEVTEAECS